MIFYIIKIHNIYIHKLLTRYHRNLAYLHYNYLALPQKIYKNSK